MNGKRGSIELSSTYLVRIIIAIVAVLLGLALLINWLMQVGKIVQ